MAGVAGRSGRPPLPMALAEANGATIMNPARFAGRVETDDVLDNIPLGMISPDIMVDPMLTRLWTMIARELPWLRESDRIAVEIACHCRAALYTAIAEGRQCDEKTMNLLLRVMAALGGTPTSIHKILPPKSKDDGKKAKKGSRFAREFIEGKAA